MRLADLTPDPVTFDAVTVQERSSSHFLLTIEGTSAAATSAEAQAAFMTFLANLDEASFLLRRSEPRLLRLMPAESARSDRRTSRFQMDLILKRRTPEPEGETL